MAALRTSHDSEQDVLQGRNMEESRAEVATLMAKANALTAYLSRSHAGLTAIVRQNLETERNGLEMAAANLEGRIAEFAGEIQRVRELPVPLSPRARRVRERAK